MRESEVREVTKARGRWVYVQDGKVRGVNGGRMVRGLHRFTTG